MQKIFDVWQESILNLLKIVSIIIIVYNIEQDIRVFTFLQLSLTHTSYRTNYGINPDHTRNSLTNCGMRQVEYGDRRIHYQNTRKRGICILVDIMSRLGKQEETTSGTECKMFITIM